LRSNPETSWLQDVLAAAVRWYDARPAGAASRWIEGDDMRKVLLILGQLSDSDVAWLARAGSRVRLQPGTELIRQDTRIDAIYIILEGSMSVWTGGMKLADVGVGDIIGEMSMLDSSLTAASVRVEQTSLVLVVPKSILQVKLTEDAPFAGRFYKSLALFLAERMRYAIRRMGYGKDAAMSAIDADDETAGEVLDNVHPAEARIDRMLKHLSGA
jgi:CRP/FNR family transcriptional regulator, cyclic AMP receptor protein